MDRFTLWVLALFGFISLLCVMGGRLASDLEELFTQLIDAYQRLRDRLRRPERPGDEDDPEATP